MCRCFPGFNGPNCELTTRSFKHNDWVWLPPPQQCSSASLSLEFATKEANGLLLYGGPTSPVRNGDVHDFITVELAGGKILVLVSLGDRDNIVRVSVTSGMTLNDGEWHHVEVSWNGTVSLELKVKFLWKLWCHGSETPYLLTNYNSFLLRREKWGGRGSGGH